ncbi:MAG: HAD hydrolase-like protein [Crocinitomicaceae bacterium]
MSKFETIFFDLDGTLCDSLEGISNSIRKSLSTCGVNNPKEKMIQKMIGMPLSVSLKRNYFPKDKLLLEKAMKAFSHHYNEIGIFESKLYPGIKQLLSSLSQESRLIIITAKPTLLAKKVAKHHKIDTYFESIKGQEFSSVHFSKFKMIKDSLPSGKSIMIGDKGSDILAGKKNKIYTAGVTYGYGKFKELKKPDPDCIIKSVEDLEQLLL